MRSKPVKVWVVWKLSDDSVDGRWRPVDSFTDYGHAQSEARSCRESYGSFGIFRITSGTVMPPGVSP